MKRLFFISCLMFMVINAMAYQPMLVEGRIWNVLLTGIDPLGKGNDWEEVVYYKIEGDSVIDGEVYKRIYESHDKIDYVLKYLMMENIEEGKVWKYGYSHLNQQYYKDLIIDFGLNVGDRLKEDVGSVCETIEYMKDKRGNTLKRMDFGEYCWIEGYGYEYYILDGGSFYLSSVEDEDGILIDFSKVADAYVPMVIDGYSWNVVYSGDGGIPTQRLYGTNKEIIKEDSIINGITYKKLWEAEDCDLEKRKLLALIREDVEKQKVYAYNKGAEVLLYDLGVEIGDTIEVLNWLYQIKYLDSTNVQNKEYNFSYLVVDSIDYIEDERYGSLKRVSYYKAGWEKRRVTIYERYGDVTGWMTSSHAEIGGMGPSHVICAFDENDELVLKREYTIEGYDDAEDCYIEAEIGTNVNITEEEARIYYNSQDRILCVDFEGDERIDIYNTMGKSVMTREINLDCKSISCNLNTGVYIVKAKNSNRHAKIVVK